jgi:hypothetical protein
MDHGTPCTAVVHCGTGTKQPQGAQHPKGLSRTHAFDDAYEPNDIELPLTTPSHSRTHGQVERLHRTLKDATIKRDDSASPQPLKVHLDTFVNAYNVAKCLKIPQGLTPDAYIIQYWRKEPERCKTNLCHHTVGLNI